MHILEAESYNLFGELSEDLSLGGSLSDPSGVREDPEYIGVFVIKAR